MLHKDYGLDWGSGFTRREVHRYIARFKDCARRQMYGITMCDRLIAMQNTCLGLGRGYPPILRTIISVAHSKMLIIHRFQYWDHN